LNLLIASQTQDLTMATWMICKGKKNPKQVLKKKTNERRGLCKELVNK
jgi:hypothetical protein